MLKQSFVILAKPDDKLDQRLDTTCSPSWQIEEAQREETRLDCFASDCLAANRQKIRLITWKMQLAAQADQFLEQLIVSCCPKGHRSV